MIDDKLSDVEGILLTLQALLLEQENEQEKIGIAFFHICWDSDENTLSQNARFFQREFQKVREKITSVGRFPLKGVEYIPIPLKKEEYNTQDDYKRIKDHIVEKQRKFLKEFYKRDISFPQTDQGSTFTYAIFLDIVLNLEKDRENIVSGNKVLSHHLYETFTQEHCIMYTVYTEEDIPEKWVCTEGITEKPIDRDNLAKARSIYLPLERKLHQILKIS